MNIYKVVGKGWLVPKCKLVVQGLTGSSQSINFKNIVNHSQRIKISKLLSTVGLQEKQKQNMYRDNKIKFIKYSGLNLSGKVRYNMRSTVSQVWLV